MAAEGSKRVEVAGLGDKRQVTATFAASLDADSLPGENIMLTPKVYFP